MASAAWSPSARRSRPARVGTGALALRSEFCKGGSGSIGGALAEVGIDVCRDMASVDVFAVLP